MVALGSIAAGLVVALTALNVLAAALVVAIERAGIPGGWSALIVGGAWPSSPSFWRAGVWRR